MNVYYFNSTLGWYWEGPEVIGKRYYTRRQDAVRGFERFCARVRAM
jgi:hypothetical protein